MAHFAHRLSAIALAAACLGAAAPNKKPVDVPVAVIEDKIRGGLLGEMLGDLNGLPYEMKYIAEPGDVQHYVPALPDGAWTDDDTDIEWIYVVDMQQSGRLLLTPQRIAELWKRHINRKIWCSHLYLRSLLDLGVEPPLTGMLQFNPWADFNLSGQFVSETWGLISPGMPQTASRIGLHYTHVSIEGEPAQSTQLFAAMIATAFFTDDINRILDAGAASVDPQSKMRRIVDEVRRLHRQYPKDWRAARRGIRDAFSYYGGEDMRDRNGVELNAAGTVAALLYGQGDFVETVRHAFNFGWDCDNNAATSGTIIGVIQGYRRLAAHGWTIQDRFRNTSRDQMPDDETITRFGDRLCAIAARSIEAAGGSKVNGANGPAYRIPVEAPANVEKLVNPSDRTKSLKSTLGPKIETDLVSDRSTLEHARAAYLAICLDFAQGLRTRHPTEWGMAVAALNSRNAALHPLFYETPIPAGEALRKKLLAAGVTAPKK